MNLKKILDKEKDVVELDEYIELCDTCVNYIYVDVIKICMFHCNIEELKSNISNNIDKIIRTSIADDFSDDTCKKDAIYEAFSYKKTEDGILLQYTIGCVKKAILSNGGNCKDFSLNDLALSYKDVIYSLSNVVKQSNVDNIKTNFENKLEDIITNILQKDECVKDTILKVLSYKNKFNEFIKNVPEPIKKSYSEMFKKIENKEKNSLKHLSGHSKLYEIVISNNEIAHLEYRTFATFYKGNVVALLNSAEKKAWKLSNDIFNTAETLKKQVLSCNDDTQFYEIDINKIEDSKESNEIQEAIRLYFDLFNSTPIEHNNIKIMDSTSLCLYAEVKKVYDNCGILKKYKISVWEDFFEDIKLIDGELEQYEDAQEKVIISKVAFYTESEKEMDKWIDEKCKSIRFRYGINCIVEYDYLRN